MKTTRMTLSALTALLMIAAAVFSSCTGGSSGIDIPSLSGSEITPSRNGETSVPSQGGETPDPSQGGEIPTPSQGDETPDPSQGDETPTPTPVTPTPGETTVGASFSSSRDGKELLLTVTAESGSFSAAEANGVLYLTVGEESVLSFAGAYAGGVRISAPDDVNVEIALKGCALYAEGELPALYFDGCKNAEISAKSGTENYIYDNRNEVEELASAIYATCDLKLKGSGALTVESDNNGGVHTKDDLEIKNLTLSVNAEGNALKGNDSVTVTSGTITLISRQEDGVKTGSSSLSASGEQKGNVTISGGKLTVYAACDGIDSACDVMIGGSAVVSVYTDRYSEYSEEVTTVSGDSLYIRSTVSSYKYSVFFSNGGEDGVWVNSAGYTSVASGGGGGFGGRTTYYYYEIEKPAGYGSLTVYVYTSSQAQGQSSAYAAVSSRMTLNASFDTIAFSNSRGRTSFNWTAYQAGGGGGGGFGGGGNRDKGTYSTKGVKAANEILITGGSLTVEAYDDAIHAGNGTALESGKTAAGGVTISGGSVTVSSNDDGIHADGTLEISGGMITVKKSYEGLEGNVVSVSGGQTKVTASDDGVNATTGASSAQIKITGGYLDITVPPSGDSDGIDSNGSFSMTGGVLITRGPNSQMMAALDADSGVSVTGGTLIILGYGNVRTVGNKMKTYSLSLHSSGNHSVKIGGVTYTFGNAYSYGRTTVYSDVEVTNA